MVVNITTFSSANVYLIEYKREHIPSLLKYPTSLFINTAQEKNFVRQKKVYKRTVFLKFPKVFSVFLYFPPFLLSQENYNTEIIHGKLLEIGKHIGIRISERTTLDKDRFEKELDMIKFICKEFWNYAFKKAQVDKLQTNHKGTYVIHDFDHPWISKISHMKNKEVMKQFAYYYLHIASGMIQGALVNLGCSVQSVKVEISDFPKCHFSIQMTPDPAEESTAVTAIEGETT
ncbi:hypothetical protein RFI_00757 [Reticulomyxa filosa]|uniref:Trafficking protein particle complex subunit 6B n=1 Tax=Reticulomyxa filosa TaxID=46433 RepID=X6PDM7_RETFI|nr:hypothetical protein RFI_00757 [Reticulomyxa filosa]|eukprot:ETO36306.1 hypothetical protein RFI_00757 [Reticulomyxa filosa]